MYYLYTRPIWPLIFTGTFRTAQFAQLHLELNIMLLLTQNRLLTEQILFYNFINTLKTESAELHTKKPCDKRPAHPESGKNLHFVAETFYRGATYAI